MRAGFVIVVTERIELPLEVSACPERHVVQELSTNGPD